MEVLRAKFFEPKPQAVEALAYSPDGAWLAIARPGASIEIWDPLHQQIRFRIAGNSKKNIKALVWKHNGCSGLESYRLFGTGLHSEVVEWDLQRHCERSSVSTHGGAAFDMCETADNGLAIACDDGSVRLFDIDDDGLVYKSALKGAKSRILSVCCVGNMLFTGGSDNLICRWNLKTQTCDERMSVEKTKNGTLVWRLIGIGDGLIASGDSTGNVMIWDVNTCTLVRKFAQHQADVLSMASIPKLGLFASGGVDSKISVFSVSEGDVQFTNALFSHTHDIRALAAAGCTLVSGGPDAEVHFHPLDNAANKNKHWYLTSTPFGGDMIDPVSMSGRLVLCQHRESADIWYLQPMDQTIKPTKVWNIKLESDGHLLSSAICGSVVALSDEEGTRIFKLNQAELVCKKIPADLLKSTAASAMKFVGETKLVVCDRNSFELHIYDIEEQTLETFAHESPVLLLAHFGPWLAAADVCGRISIYNLDSLKLHSHVPAFEDGVVTAMCFDRTNRLMLASSAQTWQYYDLMEDKIVNHGLLPTQMKKAHRVLGIHQTANSEGKFLFWGQDFWLKMNLKFSEDMQKGVKRKLGQFDQKEEPWQVEYGMSYTVSFHIVDHQFEEYRKNRASEEMCLVCEVPKKKVQTMLPEQFQRKKFARARRKTHA